jgi:predicted nucleic acid-binding protein
VIVVDTTVLVYAVGKPHPLREPCERLLEAVAAGRVAATTSAGVIQEFAHVRARRIDRSNAAVYAGRYAELLAPLLPVREEEVEPALRLFELHSALDAFDAFLVAAALAHDASALVSADQAFAAVAEVRFVHPGTPELDSLIT